MLFFFFNDTATTEIYTLSLHDALPISGCAGSRRAGTPGARRAGRASGARPRPWSRSCARSEEHTSELQSHLNLVCRLLLEKKKHHPPRGHYHFSDTPSAHAAGSSPDVS